MMKRLAIASLTLVILSGCETLGTNSNQPPEEQVRQRAQAWADALLEGDIKAAWKYTSPSYRDYADSDAYFTEVAGSTRWTGATVKSVDCEIDVCSVRIMVAYTIKHLDMSNERPIKYKWLLVNGKWWLHVGN